ncbi:unnamed protein product, partial [Prorocentrum cordatum]
ALRLQWWPCRRGRARPVRYPPSPQGGAPARSPRRPPAPRAASRVSPRMQGSDVEGWKKQVTAADRMSAAMRSNDFLVAWLVPAAVFMFLLVLYACAFMQAPLVCGAFSCVAFAATLVCALCHARRPAMLPLALSMLVATAMGTLFGLYCYDSYSIYPRFYSNARTYDNVVASEPAAAVADAGKIAFTTESYVSAKEAAGYVTESGTISTRWRILCRSSPRQRDREDHRVLGGGRRLLRRCGHLHVRLRGRQRCARGRRDLRRPGRIHDFQAQLLREGPGEGHGGVRAAGADRAHVCAMGGDQQLEHAVHLLQGPGDHIRGCQLRRLRLRLRGAGVCDGALLGPRPDQALVVSGWRCPAQAPVIFGGGPIILHNVTVHAVSEIRAPCLQVRNLLCSAALRGQAGWSDCCCCMTCCDLIVAMPSVITCMPVRLRDGLIFLLAHLPSSQVCALLLRLCPTRPGSWLHPKGEGVTIDIPCAFPHPVGVIGRGCE